MKSLTFEHIVFIFILGYPPPPPKKQTKKKQKKTNKQTNKQKTPPKTFEHVYTMEKGERNINTQKWRNDCFKFKIIL